jgi:hypothetical protein
MKPQHPFFGFQLRRGTVVHLNQQVKKKDENKRKGRGSQLGGEF